MRPAVPSGFPTPAIGKRNRLNEAVMKPKIIICYNKGKQGIDISDQMASYFTPLRKIIRGYYHKVAFEFLLNTVVVNALTVYQEITGNNVKMSNFTMASSMHLQM